MSTELIGILVVGAIGGINLGFVLKMLFNHLEHMAADLKEIRGLFINLLANHK